VFRDYDVNETVEVKTEVVTPVKKRKMEELTTPKVEFPLTPPATLKSESVSIDLQIEESEERTKVIERFVRRSKRRRVGIATDNPFTDN